MPPPALLLRLAILLLLGSACTSNVVPKTRSAKAPLDVLSRQRIENRDLGDALAAASAALQARKPQLDAYNLAVERFLIALQKQTPVSDWAAPVTVRTPEREYQVTFDPAAQPPKIGEVLSPAMFSRLIPANGYKIKGCDHIVAGTGIGAPVIMAREDVEKLVEDFTFRPRVGAYLPGTALLEFGKAAPGAPVPVHLRIHNAYEKRSIQMASATRPLSCNVSAAVQLSLDNRYIRNNALIGLLRPDKRTNDIGLFGLNAYDPKKIPVVYVHGLKSGPYIWKNAVNEIYHDPELAERYQPVLFLYPSGLSVPASAARLRRSLQSYRDHWDPEHDDPGMDRMLLVGHSMGGILSRLQVIDSGDDVREAFFSRPVREVPWLTSEQAEQVESALVFERQPFVQRAVFIATPHRGSRIADWAVVRLAIRLIKLPTDALSLATEALLFDTSLLNPALLSYNLLGLRSVDMLSPGHPYFEALEKRPILAPFHSIIGTRGKGVPPDTSDGIVPYTSAHLEGAESELLVPYAHSCAAKPETVQEILRVLRLHARSHP